MLLDVENLEVFYGDVQAIFGISFCVDEGEIVSIVGSNAAGKSTTLRAISGILESKTGSIKFNGRPMEDQTPDKIVEAGIVQIPEGRQLFPAMTVQENLEMGSFMPEAKKKRAETLKQVYRTFPILEERSKQFAATLSGGEQQMLAIGRGLMSLPKLLMFDEPSLGLAPMLVKEIFNIAKDINAQGTTVLMVEQNVYHALSMSSRAYVLENGRFVLEGKGKDLLEDENVKKAYMGI